MAHYTDCLTPRKERNIGANFTDESELHIVDQNGLDKIDTSMNDCTKAFFADYSNEKERDQFEVAETFRNENIQQPLIPETLDMQKLKRATYQASDIRYNHDTDCELRRPVVSDGQMNEHDSDEQQGMKVDDYDDVDQNPHILKLDKDGYLKPVNVVQVHNLEPNLTHQNNELRSSFHGYEGYDPSTGGTNTRQDSNEGILRPPTTSVTDIDEETIIENQYNTIYDTQVVDQGKNRNNTECMMKTKCRILIALLVVILLMTSVALFVIIFTHPGWSKCNCDHTTFTTKTTHKSEVIYPTELEFKETTESINAASYLDLQFKFDIQGNRDNTTFTTKSTYISVSLPTVSTNTSKDGSSFWIAFPTIVWYSARSYIKIILSIVSNTPLSLTIRTLNNTSHYLTDPLNPTLGLPYTLIQNYNTIEDKGILVTTNDSASIYTASFLRSSNDFADMSWIPPSDKLGTFYIAVSYHPVSSSDYSYISIASLNADTSVNITINTTGTFTYNGITYGNGDILSLHLNTFSSVQVSCKKDITGSTIRSSQPIVVQSGITGFKVSDSGCFSSVSVYLPPVPAWGKTFVVPPIVTAIRYAVRIVPSQLGTTLSVTSNSMVNSYVLTATLELSFNANEVLLIECNNPCFVSQYPASESKDNLGVTSYMVTVPAVEQFSRDYHIHSPYFFHFKSHFLSVMIKSDEADGLLLNGTNVNSYNMTIENVKNSQITWTVFSFNVTHGTHTVSHTSPNVVYGVINYGFGRCKSYGYVAGLNI